MTSAVGPFAVDYGIFKFETDMRGLVTVRIHNTNTGKLIHSTFPVVQGEAAAHGNFAIDGVSGKAARIRLDFLKPAGSKTGKLFPTGSKLDVFDGIETTCIDVGNPCCFVKASSFGIAGNIAPASIEAQSSLLKQLDLIRRQAGVRMGLAGFTSKIPGSIPKICLISRPSHEDEIDIDILARAISVGQPHKAVPITVALSIATAAKISGTIVNECTSNKPVNSDSITIGHASGKLMVGASLDQGGQLLAGTVFRTARRLMEGRVFYK